jgi:Bax protein
MKLYDLFEDDLTEAPFGKFKSAATGLALGGLALTGYVGHNIANYQDSNQVKPLPPGQFNGENDGEIIPALAKPKPYFPNQLKDLDSLPPKEKIQEFQNQFLPYINQSNQDILNQRNHILRLQKLKNISDQDQQWLNYMLKHYKANDINDLLLKVDYVPRSLALAQAAIESSWAQASIAQNGDVFYGQRADGDNTISDDKGGTYSVYKNPLDSVKAYMYNLNTNNAYKEFRTLRAKQRENGLLNGQQLATTLIHYSSKKMKYIHTINKLIHEHKWYLLDKSAS